MTYKLYEYNNCYEEGLVMIYPMYIANEWYEGDNDFKDVINPSNGEIIGRIPMGTAEEVDIAVNAAKKAQIELESMSVFERADMLVRISEAILNRREDLANLLCKEHGKPYVEALGEVDGCILAFKEVSEQIKWMDSKIIPLRETNKKCFVLNKPIGIFGIITPWNYPIGTASMYYLAPGLAAGCPMIWNPATSTAAIASEFMKCFSDAKIPKGFVSLVIGKGSVVGDALSVHPSIAGIGFTGSTETGNTICERAKTKHTQMELGGNGPSIVLKDADLELAAEKLMVGSFTNAGQICTSTERVLIDDEVADDLVKIMLSQINKYVLGDPTNENTTMGPMHSLETVNIVKKHIEDAVDKGANVLCGGKRQDNSPTEHFILPTIIDNLSIDSLINIEETFGPVLSLVRFKNESEIPELIEKSPYRLFASIFTKDIDKALTMADRYKFGAILINESSNAWDTMIPAGGGGGSASGHGRSGGKYSIEDFSETRAIILNLQTKL